MASQNLPATLKGWLDNPTIQERFNEVLGKKAKAFTSALLNIYNSNEQLQKCDPRSIIGAAGLAATTDLSLTPSLGQAYIVPFRTKDGYKAQFQLGTKGLIQLAHRSERFTRLHAGKVYEGEIKAFNPITGEPERGERTGDKVVGYVAYMRLVNGFEKSLFMTVEELEAHAEKYSQSYRVDKQKGWTTSPWTTNFDAMASKTVLKKLLGTWGRLSTEIVEVLQGDQSVVDKNSFTYVDNGGNSQNRGDLYVADDGEVIDADTGEVVTEAPHEEPQT